MKELNLLLTAIQFYTRIPVPRDLDYSDEKLNHASRYLPLVGLVVGGLAAAFVMGALKFLPIPVAVILSMALTIFITGAFHEDGFADFCDGFGGGLTREKIIQIMKDSRIGAYGTIGIVAILLTKFALLSEVNSSKLPFILIAAHAASRLMPVLVIYSSKYVRDDETSKIKPIGKKGRDSDLLVAITFGLGALFFLHWKFALAAIPVVFIVPFIFRAYIVKKIGGYTGDTLGALQQIGEVCIYLLFLAFQDNIL
jgi:adenosylcobinamide-GDP ribazoletransferase